MDWLNRAVSDNLCPESQVTLLIYHLSCLPKLVGKVWGGISGLITESTALGLARRGRMRAWIGSDSFNAAVVATYSYIGTDRAHP